jgi:hypothetical protein
MTTSTMTVPPISAFRNPGFTEATPLTVTPDRRIFGYLCERNRAHIAFNGRRVFAPLDDDLSFFLTGATDVIGDDGEVMEISVGKLTMNTSHASTDNHVTADAAARHYDHTGTIAAFVNAGIDDIGIWMAGVLLPDLDEMSTMRLRGCGASGDWRMVDGKLRLVAALSVPVGGFPIPRARVASGYSGEPMAMVAAGFVAPAATFGKAVDPSWTKPVVDAPIVSGKLSSGVSGARVEIGSDGSVKWFSVSGEQVVPATAPSPATLAAQIDRALEARERKTALAAKRAALLAEVDDAPRRHAALVASLDDTGERKARLLAELADGEDFDTSQMPPQLQKEWLTGKIAARIVWGTEGAYDRCRAIAREKSVPGHEIDGMCANLKRAAEAGSD